MRSTILGGSLLSLHGAPREHIVKIVGLSWNQQKLVVLREKQISILLDARGLVIRSIGDQTESQLHVFWRMRTK